MNHSVSAVKIMLLLLNDTRNKMIDIKLIREEPEKYKVASKRKNISADIDRLLQIDTWLRDKKKTLQDS